MKNSKIYIEKIERSREVAATGFRLKRALYCAALACHAERKEFPFQHLLDAYGVPSGNDYLSDREYYLLTDEGFVPTTRPLPEKERLLRSLAEQVGAKVVFTKEREPVLLVGDWVLRAAPRGTQPLEDTFTVDLSVPYDLYPRVINIVGGLALVEVSEGVCEWQSFEEAGVE